MRAGRREKFRVPGRKNPSVYSCFAWSSAPLSGGSFASLRMTTLMAIQACHPERSEGSPGQGRQDAGQKIENSGGVNPLDLRQDTRANSGNNRERPLSMKYMVMALLAGMLLPVQAGMNAVLAKHTSPFWALLLSFLVGLPAAMAAVALSQEPWPGTAALKSVPLWAWPSGALGAVYVSVLITGASHVGAGMLMALVVAGQMAAALALDHYGMAGFGRQPLDAWRVGGALLLAAGVWMMSRP
jgi:transporter family-2 protein